MGMFPSNWQDERFGYGTLHPSSSDQPVMAVREGEG